MLRFLTIDASRISPISPLAKNEQPQAPAVTSAAEMQRKLDEAAAEKRAVEEAAQLRIAAVQEERRAVKQEAQRRIAAAELEKRAAEEEVNRQVVEAESAKLPPNCHCSKLARLTPPN